MAHSHKGKDPLPPPERDTSGATWPLILLLPPPPSRCPTRRPRPGPRAAGSHGGSPLPDDATAHVDVLGHRRPSVPELVGDGTSGHAPIIKQRGHCPASGVRPHPLERRLGPHCPQVAPDIAPVSPTSPRVRSNVGRTLPLRDTGVSHLASKLLATIGSLTEIVAGSGPSARTRNRSSLSRTPAPCPFPTNQSRNRPLRPMATPQPTSLPATLRAELRRSIEGVARWDQRAHIVTTGARHVRALAAMHDPGGRIAFRYQVTNVSTGGPIGLIVSAARPRRGQGRRGGGQRRSARR